MPNTRHHPSGWSTLSIAMHWLIVVLIIAQVIDHDWVRPLGRALRDGQEPDTLTAIMGYGHFVVGGTILVAALIRLWDRFTRGRPAYPAEEPNWATRLAKITHFLIYAILVAMPIAGMLAWFGGIEIAGDIHELMWTPLLVLIGLHIAGALAQHFYFKTNVLKRIVKPA